MIFDTRILVDIVIFWAAKCLSFMVFKQKCEFSVDSSATFLRSPCGRQAFRWRYPSPSKRSKDGRIERFSHLLNLKVAVLAHGAQPLLHLLLDPPHVLNHTGRVPWNMVNYSVMSVGLLKIDSSNQKLTNHLNFAINHLGCGDLGESPCSSCNLTKSPGRGDRMFDM